MAERPEAHIRHAGLFIDASFVKGSNGTEVEYYVVEGGIGRFYSLAVAKEIAEARALLNETKRLRVRFEESQPGSARLPILIRDELRLTRMLAQ